AEHRPGGPDRDGEGGHRQPPAVRDRGRRAAIRDGHGGDGPPAAATSVRPAGAGRRLRSRPLPAGRQSGVRAVLAALVAGCVVAVSGCSGAGTAVPAAAAATAANSGDSTLAAGLLTVDDLPLGFQPQDGAGAAAALGCAGIDGVYLPAGSSAHATASFAHSLSAAFINETVTLRPGGAAAAALDRFGAAATDCGRFSGPNGTRYTVTPVSLPGYG